MGKRHDERIREGDRVEEMMREQGMVGSLDPERIRVTVEALAGALQRQAERLRDMDLTEPMVCPACGKGVQMPLGPKNVAQTMAYAGKVLDEIYRLSEFAVGKADSRPDLGMADLLAMLTDEQVGELGRWVELGKARRAGVGARQLLQ